VGTVLHIRGGVYHATSGQGEALYFYSDQRLLCGHHSRGMCLQPFTSYDHESGFGSKGCPFCKGGELVGQFTHYRSRKQVRGALDALVKNDPTDR
jgi:hypothetical protein